MRSEVGGMANIREKTKDKKKSTCYTSGGTRGKEWEMYVMKKGQEKRLKRDNEQKLSE